VVTGRRRPVRPRPVVATAGILAVAMLAALLSACSGGGYDVVATFRDSGDLQSRGSVQVADLRVGTVGKITLTKDFQSRVVLHINGGIKVPKDSEAVLRTTSLLGEKFVELHPVANPTKGPFLQNGDTIANSIERPELEVVAETAVKLLGAVTATDVQTIVATGAQGFGGRGPQLAALIGDLNQISGTLASRTKEIGSVIDNLDHATQTLAAGAPALSDLLSNLASATTLLAKDREQAVTALASLTHLAEAADYSLNKYQSDIDREIKQVDAVTATLVTSLGSVQVLLDWLQRFAVDFPKGIFGNFGGIYLRVVPYLLDPRSPK
jgi:phospholipid/cholesterol/gamma-HCH transport system substrate-binding protein